MVLTSRPAPDPVQQHCDRERPRYRLRRDQHHRHGRQRHGPNSFNDIGVLLLGNAPLGTTTVGTSTTVSTGGSLTIKGTGGNGGLIDNRNVLAAGIVPSVRRRVHPSR